MVQYSLVIRYKKLSTNSEKIKKSKDTISHNSNTKLACKINRSRSDSNSNLSLDMLDRTLLSKGITLSDHTARLLMLSVWLNISWNKLKSNTKFSFRSKFSSLSKKNGLIFNAITYLPYMKKKGEKMREKICISVIQWNGFL